MVNKYFNVEVKPTILASQLAASAYSSGDVVFDWHAIDVPKGASKLIGVTAVMRQKHGTAGNEFAFQLVYGKSINNVAPSSLGTGSATADGTGYYNNVIGKSTFTTNDYMSDILDNGVTIAALAQGGASSEKPSIVLEGEPNSGTNVGYDKLYVGMIAEGAFDFTTAAEISQAITIADNTGSFADADVEGTELNLVFAPGDVIHAADDIIIGEVDTVAAAAMTFKFGGEATTSGTNYTVPADLAAFVTQNGAGTAGDLADGDELINVNPIKIILHFEK
jgi:hypothetical protein|tara:strand:+ start:84 stop:917 length:834 start_codon:yes stop_codon:yes gene_type:complete